MTGFERAVKSYLAYEASLTSNNASHDFSNAHFPDFVIPNRLFSKNKKEWTWSWWLLCIGYIVALWWGYKPISETYWTFSEYTYLLLGTSMSHFKDWGRSKVVPRPNWYASCSKILNIFDQYEQRHNQTSKLKVLQKSDKLTQAQTFAFSAGEKLELKKKVNQFLANQKKKLYPREFQ